MRLILFSIFSVLISVNLGYAQTDLQKAKTKVTAAKDYKQEVEALIALSELWFGENMDSAKYYAKKAEAISIKNNYHKGLFKFHPTYTTFLIFEANYDEALKLSLKNNSLAIKVGDKENIARSTANVGNCYNYKGDFAKAIQYFQRAIVLFKANNQPQYERKINMFICLCFYNSNNLTKALEYSKMVIEQAVKVNDKELELSAQHLTGGAYIEINEHKKALPFSQRAYFLADSLKFEKDKYASATDLSRIYFAQKNVDLAIKTLLPALHFFEKTKNDYYMVNALTFYSQYLLAQNQIDAANDKLNEALVIAQKNKMKAHLPLIYENFVKVMKAKGDYKLAFEYNEIYQTHLDSLNSKDLKKQLQDLDVKYESTKKESQITQQKALIKQKTYNNYLLVGGLCALAIFTILGFRNYGHRQQIQSQKIKELEQEKQLTAVSSIMQGQEKERSRMAKDLHDGLGGILSGIKLNLSAMKGNQIMQEADANIFSRSISQLDTAIQEMRRVAHNLMPEALLKFGLNEAVQDFCDGINQVNTVKMKFNHYGPAINNDQSLQVILYRIIQELSNNAIKYAEANSILIQLTNHETGISLTVEDDGKGFNTSDLEKNRGAGIENVISRVNYLKGTFNIDSEIGKGTSCFIEIPSGI